MAVFCLLLFAEYFVSIERIKKRILFEIKEKKTRTHSRLTQDEDEIEGEIQRHTETVSTLYYLMVL